MKKREPKIFYDEIKKEVEIKKIFSERLSELVNNRKKQGLTQKEIADEIGISSGSLSAYCDTSKIASINSLALIAQYFNVSTDYLLGFSKASSQDVEIQSICKYTGLSEKALDRLKFFTHYDSSLINALLLHPRLQTAINAAYTSVNLSEKISERETSVKELYNLITDENHDFLIDAIGEFRTVYDVNLNYELFGKVVMDLSPKELAKHYYIVAKDELSEAFIDVYKDLLKEKQK